MKVVIMETTNERCGRGRRIRDDRIRARSIFRWSRREGNACREWHRHGACGYHRQEAGGSIRTVQGQLQSLLVKLWSQEQAVNARTDSELTESTGESGTNTTAATTVTLSGQCTKNEWTEGLMSCGDAATVFQITEESMTVPTARMKWATSDASETTDRVERRTQVKIDYTQLTVRQPDIGNDRARQLETDPQKPAWSTQSSISLGTVRCVVPRSRRDSPQHDRFEQADRREVQNELVSKLERGRRVAAQLQESRDMMLDGKPWQKSAKPQGRGTQTAFRQEFQDESDRHAVTLDEKDDQEIFRDGSSLLCMRRLILGESLGPGSIACWDTRKIKNAEAIAWQDRADDLEG